MTRENGTLSENALIQEIFEPLTHIGYAKTPEKPARSDVHFVKKTRKALTFGLRDDCVLGFIPDNKQIVLSKDVLVEGVHFIGSEKPADIARKALRVNVSDLASSAAQPYGYMLGLSLTDKQNPAWLKNFASGLKTDQNLFELPLLGGDIVHTPGPFTISITILGLSDTRTYVSRTGAQLEDQIYVSGTIGDAVTGLALALNMAGLDSDMEQKDWLETLTGESAEYLLNRYQMPEPRINLTSEIAQFCTSAMDVSDGLLGDILNLCEASDVGAEIHINKTPLSPALKGLIEKQGSLLETALNGGDDYEILCTVPRNLSSAFEKACYAKNTKITHIGHITHKPCRFIMADGSDYTGKISSYSHVKDLN